MTSMVDRRPFPVGAATVDPVSREATWRGGSERLQPQTLKVLIALVSRCGEVVTRDELVQLCWNGRIVGDDVINRSILLLRHFAERAGGFEIETVPRTGYRLVETSSRVPLKRRHAAMAALVTGVLVLASLGVALRFHSRRAPPPTPALTIALLPFSAASTDPQMSKLASATHEAIATTLSQGAFALTALDAAPKEPVRSADFTISGQLSESSGKLIATVRMEENEHHVVVFTHRFEQTSDKADDLPELVAGQVASQVSWTAPLLTLERQHPLDPTIIASLLQQSSAGLQGGGELHDYELSRRLAAKDPGSPLAQLDLAFYTGFALDEIPLDQRSEAVSVGRAAADRALSLAPEFGDTYVPWCLLHSEQRMVECEKRLRAGVRADPDSPFAGWFLGSLILNPVGRNDEAVELARAALADDPYMPAKIGLMLRTLEATGQGSAAEGLYQRAMRWWPNNGGLNFARMSGIAEYGDFERLAGFLHEVGDPKKPNAVILAISRGSMPAIRAACGTAKDFDATVCMLALARFGDTNLAFALADRLYPSRRGRTLADDDRIWLNYPGSSDTAFLTGPAAAPLRRDPRFLAVVQRVGLLDYWRSGRLPDFCTKAHERVCGLITRKPS